MNDKAPEQADSTINGELVPAKTRVHMTPGQSLRVIRELQELSQNEFKKVSINSVDGIQWTAGLI